ncbi:MAG: hypothetical protein A3J38_02110 [Gammaproteobacteria bacterium RIFCSPHIGHO2_12_FULL_45_9]|nr:MAG: hypothetical protein A3J38_02110 [Gammaproteobacteria bacterium RIFCSPHIGHO2_12_FULL_45_9]
MLTRHQTMSDTAQQLLLIKQLHSIPKARSFWSTNTGPWNEQNDALNILLQHASGKADTLQNGQIYTKALNTLKRILDSESDNTHLITLVTTFIQQKLLGDDIQNPQWTYTALLYFYHYLPIETRQDISIQLLSFATASTRREATRINVFKLQRPEDSDANYQEIIQKLRDHGIVLEKPPTALLENITRAFFEMIRFFPHLLHAFSQTISWEDCSATHKATLIQHYQQHSMRNQGDGFPQIQWSRDAARALNNWLKQFSEHEIATYGDAIADTLCHTCQKKMTRGSSKSSHTSAECVEALATFSALPLSEAQRHMLFPLIDQRGWSTDALPSAIQFLHNLLLQEQDPTRIEQITAAIQAAFSQLASLSVFKKVPLLAQIPWKMLSDHKQLDLLTNCVSHYTQSENIIIELFRNYLLDSLALDETAENTAQLVQLFDQELRIPEANHETRFNQYLMYMGPSAGFKLLQIRCLHADHIIAAEQCLAEWVVQDLTPFYDDQDTLLAIYHFLCSEHLQSMRHTFFKKVYVHHQFGHCHLPKELALCLGLTPGNMGTEGMAPIIKEAQVLGFLCLFQYARWTLITAQYTQEELTPERCALSLFLHATPQQHHVNYSQLNTPHTP